MEFQLWPNSNYSMMVAKVLNVHHADAVDGLLISYVMEYETAIQSALRNAESAGAF